MTPVDPKIISQVLGSDQYVIHNPRINPSNPSLVLFEVHKNLSGDVLETMKKHGYNPAYTTPSFTHYTILCVNLQECQDIF